MLNQIKGYWKALRGRKTYIVATVGTLLNLLIIIDPTAFTQSQIVKIDGVLIFLGGAALRAAIK